jgi:hypothetical protein
LGGDFLFIYKLEVSRHGGEHELRSLTHITDVSDKPVASIFRAQSEYGGNRSAPKQITQRHNPEQVSQERPQEIIILLSILIQNTKVGGPVLYSTGLAFKFRPDTDYLD